MTNTFERLAAALADRYRIERELGQGGMATVYLAEDIKHKRKVALKVLKPELAAVLGAERFVQEITTTAALQHPHILPLFDSGTADGFLYYVMPFIDGETLRDKLNRETQLGVDEAVRIARDVADALHYAHTHGVIHRDIKPENILLANGRPMVADFGIALALSAAAGGRMTETGLSLGTPHYMSPEQATAEKDISTRSDVYSLASVLYEMLAGQPPHLGGSAQQIIMKIITETPASVTTLRKSVPQNVAYAVAKALEKLPADRFENAKEFADALVNPAFTTASASVSAMVSGRLVRPWLRDPRSWAALALIVVLGAAVATLRMNGSTGAPSAKVIRMSVVSPVDSTFVFMGTRGSINLREPVVSPDGRYLAFAVTTTTGPALYLRALDSFTPIRIDADEADSPFFSADGTSLAFLKRAELWRLDLDQREPVRVADIPEAEWDIVGATWHKDGRILVAGSRGLWAVPGTGGTPTMLVRADTTRSEIVDYVTALDDGRIVVRFQSPDGSRAEVRRADGTDARPLAAGLQFVRVVDDVMFYVERDQLHATLFDPGSLKPLGGSMALSVPPNRRVGRDFAWSGVNSRAPLELVWVDSIGSATPTGAPPGAYRWPRLSPELRRVAIGVAADQAVFFAGLRVFDLHDHTWANLSGSSEPTWSRDGRTVFMSRGNRPSAGLVQQIADGSRFADTLLALDRGDAWPTAVSPDGATLAYYGSTLGSGSEELANDPADLFFITLATRETKRFHLPGFQRGARFSPDGRWVAYSSSEKNRTEIHVRPWPALDAVYVVSNGEGTEPAWSHDGKTLFFRRRDEVLSVATSVVELSFRASNPRVLFKKPYFTDYYGDQSYDVARDGRFLMMRGVPGERAMVEVELNWLADVRARLKQAK